MTRADVTILVVTYNSEQVIASCLQNAKRSEADILVIDNASADRTVEITRELNVAIICNATNRGFAAAVNQGVLASKSPLLLLLNPDALLLTALDELIRDCQRPSVGAAGGKLVSHDGVPQKGFNVRRFPSPASLFAECIGLNRLWRQNPLNWRYRCLGMSLNEPAEVEQPAGAFLMFRRDAWLELNGFDERFFPIWFEDVDFCKRLRNHGFHVHFNPSSVAEHQGAHSIATLSLSKKSEYWYGSLLRYAGKHFSHAGKIFVCLGMLTGGAFRLIFAGLLRGNTAASHAYVAIVRLAFRSLWVRPAQVSDNIS